MTLTRRDLLQAFGVGIPLAAQRVIVGNGGSGTAPLDSPQPYKGWVLYWSEWRDLPAQLIVIGWWAAVPATPIPVPATAPILVATTTGTIQQVREADVIDLTRHADWPRVLPWTGPAVRAQVQDRALRALQARLDQEPVGRRGQ